MNSTERKAELKREFRRKEMSAARAAVPLSASEATRFFRELEARVEVNACDHTPRVARDIARGLSISEDELFAWPEANGGYCDCEIIANVYPAWEDTQNSQL